MSVYSASINRNPEDPINRLQIFRSEWTQGDEPTIKVEIVNEELESDDIISLEPWGLKAVGWTSYRNTDGRYTRSTICRKVDE